MTITKDYIENDLDNGHLIKFMVTIIHVQDYGFINNVRLISGTQFILTKVEGEELCVCVCKL